MDNRILGIVLIGGILSGCGTATIKEYDPEQADRNISQEDLFKPTPDHVIVGEYKDVVVEVNKMKTREDDMIPRQEWSVFATNNNDDDICLAVAWRLLDFQFISHHPTQVLVRSGQREFLGTMLQTVWTIDGVQFAPPPSGYVHNMTVKDPVEDAVRGEECLFLADEEEIEEL